MIRVEDIRPSPSNPRAYPRITRELEEELATRFGGAALRTLDADIARIIAEECAHRATAGMAHESLLRYRTTNYSAARELIIIQEGGYDEAVLAHALKGTKHPDDCYVPLSEWDATE
jgi:hypothetical protein